MNASATTGGVGTSTMASTTSPAIWKKFNADGNAGDGASSLLRSAEANIANA